MEAQALVTRRRHQSNRRIHVVELTESGETAFLALREAALSFDRRLRRGISPEELATLDGLLERLSANIALDDASSLGADTAKPLRARP
jgi:MarR family transcriptional regulator for hemolysin